MSQCIQVHAKRLLQTLLAALLLVSGNLHAGAPVTVNFNAGVGGATPYLADDSGTALANGLEVRVGYFDVSDANITTYASDLLYLDNHFVQIGETSTATLGGQLGAFASSGTSNSDTMDRTLYIWAFDQGSLSSGTSASYINVSALGLFTADEWLNAFESDAIPNTVNINSSEVDYARHGSTTATQLRLAAIAKEMYWDNDGGNDLGVSGTWGTANAQWNDSTGDGGDGSYNWDANFTGVFAGTAGTVSIDAGGVQSDVGLRFDVDGYTVQNNSLTLDGATASDNTITVTTSGHTATISSTISDGANNSGLTKAGAGKLVVSGAVSLSGTLDVQGGTLELGASNIIANTTDIQLSGGTLSTGGFAETVNNLTLSENSTIDLVNSTNGITFAGISTWDSSKTLTIDNWNGSVDDTDMTDNNYIRFSADPTAMLNATALNNILFAGFTGDTSILDNSGVDGYYYLYVTSMPVPIPEPGTYAAALSLLLMAGLRERRRLAGYFRKLSRATPDVS